MIVTDSHLEVLRSGLHCRWVGPMPMVSFFEEFLKTDERTLGNMPDHPNDYFNAMPHCLEEPETTQCFIDLVTDSLITSNLKLARNCENGDNELKMKTRPDIIVCDGCIDVANAQPTWYSQAELIFEFLPRDGSVDPFDDLSNMATEDDLERFLLTPNANERQKCRGQIAWYARSWMASQHRTHCFVVCIGDPYARIIRFDRSGAIVTEEFDIRSQSRLLLDFLWRFSCASPEMRGKDTTVSIVTDAEEIKLAKEKLAQWTPRISRDVLKFKIPDDGEMREVLACSPLAQHQRIEGRATRGYPAWDLKDKRLVFVKDSWRALGENISKETDILKALNEAEVCNVPKLVCGDDLRGQTTRTQDFAGAAWNEGSQPETFSKRAHIRFVSDTIGTPLTKFKSSKDFVQAWLDALLAHEEAYTKCRILHRDISLDNIMFKPEGGGFLNDWDLARTLEDIDAGPHKSSRIGTWQFMSIELLGEPDQKNTLQDDLESFIWVLLYVTIRYLLTSLVESGGSIPQTMRTIFDMAATTNHRGTVGGAYKLQVVMQRSHIGQNFHVPKNKPLSVLIENILDILYDHVQYLIVSRMQNRCLVNNKDMTVEEVTKLHRAKEKSFKFSRHSAMVEFARKALAKEWPAGDGPSDYCGACKAVAPPFKRPAVLDEPPTVGSGSEPERKKKRVKRDEQ